MVQIPAPSREAVDPKIVQMEGVIEVRPTGRPELAETINVTATDVLNAWAGMAPKVIV
jgi:hypothetical protein